MGEEGDPIYSRDRLSATCCRFTRSYVPSSTGGMEDLGTLPPVQCEIYRVGSSTRRLSPLVSHRSPKSQLGHAQAAELRIQKMEGSLSNRGSGPNSPRGTGMAPMVSVPPVSPAERRSLRPKAISKQIHGTKWTDHG